MRITAIIATAGEEALSVFPVANCSIEEMCTNGAFDESKARKALSSPGITWSSNDCRPVIAFAAELMKQQHSVLANMSVKHHENMTLSNAVLDNPKDKCQRNYLKGRYAFVRVDINWLSQSNTTKVTLSYDNPKDVVGTCIDFAHDYAVMTARILLYLYRELNGKNSDYNIILAAGKNCEGLYHEAAWMDARDDEKKRIAEINKDRETCSRRINNCYCSPIRPECPCYRRGKCEKVSLDEKWKEFQV